MEIECFSASWGIVNETNKEWLTFVETIFMRWRRQAVLFIFRKDVASNERRISSEEKWHA